MSSVTIYVLKLKGNRYYVGSTKQPVKQRFLQHVSGSGSAWTRQNEPLKIIEVRTDATPFVEDAVVLEYMQRYGPERVRGGTYSQVNLSEEQMRDIELKMCHASNRCLTCNAEGHFARYCPNRRELRRRRPNNDRKRRSSEVVSAGRQARRGNDGRVIISSSFVAPCNRCGRPGHSFRQCYATFHVNGIRLAYVDHDEEDDSSLDLSSGDEEVERRTPHWHETHAVEPYTTTHPNIVTLDLSDDEQFISCYRCGRDTHTASTCYATSDRSGRSLTNTLFASSHSPEQCAALSMRGTHVSSGCARCGRMNHTETTCFARTHVGGSPLGDQYAGHNFDGEQARNEFEDDSYGDCDSDAYDDGYYSE